MLEINNGFFHFALVLLDVAAIVVGAEVFGIEFDGFGVIGDCSVGIAFVLPLDAPVVIIRRRLWI